MVQVEFAASDAATALTRSPPGSATASTRASRSRSGATSSSRSWTAPTRSCTPPRARTPTTTTPPCSWAAPASRGSAATTPAARAPTCRPAVALVPSDAAAVGAAYPWLDYTGRWGQREKSFYNGPTGPNTKDQWTAPLTWTDDEGVDTAYAVPASGLFGTEATGAFCGIVATGSDVLRVAMNNPAWAALALGALAVFIAWLVRRTTWSPSAPLRLARRRSTGQVVASVWRMYLRHAPALRRHRPPDRRRDALPGVATVWMTSTAESLDGEPDPLRRRSSPSPGWRWSSCPRSPSRSPRRPRWSPSGRSTRVTRWASAAAYRGALRRAVPLLLTQGAIAVVLIALLGHRRCSSRSRSSGWSSQPARHPGRAVREAVRVVRRHAAARTWCANAGSRWSCSSR